MLLFKKLLLVLFYESFPINKATIQETADWKEYVDRKYHVAFKYPSNWQKDPKYSFRYGNKDGFFSFDAITGDGLSLDEVTKLDAYHLSNPYGTKPRITHLTIQGQKANLILPTNDQPEITANQAGLIVTYPTTIEFGGIRYNYFILWAHKDYILPISHTLRFI